MMHHTSTKTMFFAFCLLLLTVVSSCGPDVDYSKRDAAPRWDTAMDITEVVVGLPYAKGAELVEMSCVPCHSLRYIEMQPLMSRASWEKIVTKMIKNFGAPVRDSIAAGEIVDYLVAIRGKK